MPFRAAGYIRGGGRPPIQVPPRLASILDQSYQANEVYLVDQDGGDVAELRRTVAAYCRRQGKSLYWRVYPTHVEFMMRDKRPYGPRVKKTDEEDTA
jgi:hypothetical protein